ncbi:MAG: pyruvate kinase [Syntrophorhabdus sp.]
MALPKNKTKIVCTIGPASNSIEVMKKMIEAGMNIARLNFSHGDRKGHKQAIENLRLASKTVGTPIAIMADLPGPKMRIGQISPDPVHLTSGDLFTLTTRQILGSAGIASVTFDRLPDVVRPDNIIFLNDGLIQLEAIKVSNADIVCKVIVGGELRSRKGLNIPNIDLGISAFTEHDHEWLQFAIENGVDAISQSFVEAKSDIVLVREAAKACGRVPFIIAKIERSGALNNIDEILEAADGIMIARGDLGVEIPIERIAVVQKQLMRKANMSGKPVITATQMLESMTDNSRPTRAEATDVANAILDGTDCVMLSGESAMGKFPVESTAMLVKIAVAIEPSRPGHRVREALKVIVTGNEVTGGDLITLSVESALQQMPVTAVLIPSHSGGTAQRLTRLRLPIWIAAVASQDATCQALQFSYGVHPILEAENKHNWTAYAREWVKSQSLSGDFVILIEGPSPRNPRANHKLEIVDVK